MAIVTAICKAIYKFMRIVLLEKVIPWWKKLFKNDAQAVLAAVSALIIIGTVNVYSATLVEAAAAGTSLGSFLYKHILIILVCAFGGFITYHINYHRYDNIRIQLALSVVMFILFLLVIVFGDVVNGARRWIQIGSLSIQPSEFAKLVALIWTAAGLVKRPWKHIRIPKHMSSIASFFYYAKKVVHYLWPILIIPAFFAILTYKQPDMGTAMLILGLPFILTIIAGMDTKVMWWLLGLTVIGLAILVRFEPYRFERIGSWIDPWANARDTGYQTVQGLLAVGSGGIFGQGFTHGTSKYFYLPEAHTDFAFAVWAQELGLIGSIMVIALISMFTFYALRIAFRARDYFGSLLALGITMLISVQAVFNMLMVSGLLPVTGVPLPFISYGGSSMLLNCAAIGILLQISKKSIQNVKPIGRKKPLPSLREETQSRFKVKDIKGENHE